MNLFLSAFEFLFLLLVSLPCTPFFYSAIYVAGYPSKEHAQNKNPAEFPQILLPRRKNTAKLPTAFYL
jgi:hypothetical protein